MEKIRSTHPTELPTDPAERVDMVVTACIDKGYVNRGVLSKYYRLTQRQASLLLREFLHAQVKNIRRDAKHGGYILLEPPARSKNSVNADGH